MAKLIRNSALPVIAVVLAVVAAAPAEAQTRLPNPILYLTAVEHYVEGGQPYKRYRYDVFNKGAYPAAMFTSAPSLPPCGTNANSSRSWVDFYTVQGRRLHGFCALGTPQDLGQIWFALPASELPPSYVYIQIVDRQGNLTYRSNLADTAQ